jgi:hypothetical protein
MRVAICLLTCERFDYTKRTVESLAAHNDLSRFVLLHGDDASEDKRNVELAAAHGFERIDTPTQRQGVMEMQRRLTDAAMMLGCDWTILLQNDWESARAIPLDLLAFVAVRQDVHCLRLYGAWKERCARPAGNEHKGKGGKQAGWLLLEGAPEPAEIGDIHWGSPPAASHTGLLAMLLDGCARERDVRLKSGRVQSLTVRVVENVFWHFGSERTPAFKR